MSTTLHADLTREELMDKLGELHAEKTGMERAYSVDKEEWENVLWEIGIVEKLLQA